MRTRIPLLLIGLFIYHLANAQADTLTNQDIIELKNAGFSEKVIITKIETEPGKYDVSTKAMLDLKKNKISEDIITAMIKRKGGDKNTQKQTVTQTKTKSQQQDIKKSGIYLMTVNNELHELEPAIYSADKSSGMFSNLAAKNRASVRGASANLVISDTLPVFYFYFDNAGSNVNLADQSILFTKATSPNEFTLVRFEVVPNKNERLIVTAKGNVIDGISSGVDEKQVVSFRYKKIKDGLYEVYFANGLPKGEYAFMYAGSIKDFGTAGQKVYDFSVMPK